MSTTKRFACALLILAWAAGAAPAATWADSLFEELSKDFGSVPRGPVLTHQFKVTNNTGKQLAISNVRVSCGCVSAQAIRNVLQPGEETSIQARMDTTRFSGVKNVTIYVQFSQPSYEEVRLWVQANGRDDFAVQPDSMAFGAVKRGSAPMQSVNVVFYGDGASQITDVRTESNYIQPTIKQIRRTQTDVVYQLSASVRGDAPVGKWYSDLWLTTNNASMPRIRVPLTIEIESALSVSPDNLVIGPLKVNQEGERRVMVKGVKPFKIEKIEGADAVLTVRDSATDERAIHVLTVRVKPTQAGDVQRKIRIVTNLDKEREIEFHVNAKVTPP
jgi:hypothetical protein